MEKQTNNVGKNEILLKRDSIPNDFHLDSIRKLYDEGKIKYLGEIYDTVEDRYYSSLGGKKYRPKHKEKHLDEGHFQGYRFAIQNLSKENDWVFDPTVGSGTAIIESINNNRNAVGIELEWPDLCLKNVNSQESPLKGVVISGNAKDLSILVKNYQFDLILNGTPYPIISGNKTSDAPERKNSTMDNYMHKDSFGLLRWNGEYKNFISKMYKDSIQLLKKDGYLVTIIKDPIRNKNYFPLQETITEWILEGNKEMELYGFFIHKHIPETYFMRTYRKRFPNVKIPMYQVGLILKKQS